MPLKIEKYDQRGGTLQSTYNINSFENFFIKWNMNVSPIPLIEITEQDLIDSKGTQLIKLTGNQRTIHFEWRIIDETPAPITGTIGSGVDGTKAWGITKYLNRNFQPISILNNYILYVKDTDGSTDLIDPIHGQPTGLSIQITKETPITLVASLDFIDGEVL